MKLGLENIRKLLTALGTPQSNFLKVQVAGTNGKGSVCAFLDAICSAADIIAGVFTSPHLISITERIRINSIDISEGDFAKYASAIRETAERLHTEGVLEYIPTFFEQVTAIALVAFAEAKVELAILETGLGGRLDATTAANAEIAAITRIDYDHQEYLGETIIEIAAEKAAIIHTESAVVIGEQIPEAMHVIVDRLKSLDIDPSSADQVRTTYGSGWLKFTTKDTDYQIDKLGIEGIHQVENAKVAILLAEKLQDHFPIKSQNIINGLENARHAGRLEFSDQYLLDGAHNVGGAKALRSYLDEFVKQPITLVFGAMKEKNVTEIATILFPAADKIVFTRPENSRALTAEQLAGLVPEGFDLDRVFLTSSVREAIETAELNTSKGSVILVTGSLYLVGEAKQILRSQI